MDLSVPARDRVAVRLADEVDAEYAAALVELPGGAISVEQRVDGPNGADVSPCTTQAADAGTSPTGAPRPTPSRPSPSSTPSRTPRSST